MQTTDMAINLQETKQHGNCWLSVYWQIFVTKIIIVVVIFLVLYCLFFSSVGIKFCIDRNTLSWGVQHWRVIFRVVFSDFFQLFFSYIAVLHCSWSHGAKPRWSGTCIWRAAHYPKWTAWLRRECRIQAVCSRRCCISSSEAQLSAAGWTRTGHRVEGRTRTICLTDGPWRYLPDN